MTDLLDPNLCKEFRSAINSSPIFPDGVQKQHFNLICAVMDRLDSCLNYINSHQEPPKTEDDFIVFVTFGCMVVDAVKKLLKEIGYGYKDKADSYLYFKEICKGYPLNLAEQQCPTDDKFFEYFRSLVFAHPFETSRPNFFQKGEVQYSPWVIANSQTMATYGVGVRIYSNKTDGLMDLCFPFSALKEYIKSRYDLIEKATIWAKSKISETEAEWRKRKANKSLQPIDVLKDIADILESRYIKHYDIDTAIEYLECQTTVPSNDFAVSKFRNAIVSVIPALCEAVDALNNELLAEILSGVIHITPQTVHSMAYYQLEKIYGYLNDYHSYNNIRWGLQQAENFANEFAKKHVVINPYTMSFEEIKFLVATACFLEKQEQDGSVSVYHESQGDV